MKNLYSDFVTFMNALPTNQPTDGHSLLLGATKHLYNWLCPSVGLSVGWSATHSFDDPHVAPFGLLGLVYH